jgi:polar amino acid transport system substrate-binding protein
LKKLMVTGPKQAVFAEVPMPKCASDEVLVKAKITAISTGTELRVYRNIPVDDEGTMMHGGVPWKIPIDNGYSMAGEVLEVGCDVAGFELGDRVFVGEPHQEYAAVSADRAIKLPDGVGYDDGAFLHITQVAHNALRTGTPVPGSNVAIVGLGVVGLSAIAFCDAFGFRSVAIDTHPKRLEIAREMGAGLAVSPIDSDFLEKVKDYYAGDGADLVVEAASVWPAIKTSMDIVGAGGNVVVVARHTDRPDFNPMGHPYLTQQITLMTPKGMERGGQRWDYAHCVSLTLDMMASGRMNIMPMITNRLDWHQLPETYERLDKGDLDMVGVALQWPD